jgi:DNA-binding NarL/FixJ family response regulator
VTAIRVLIVEDHPVARAGLAQLVDSAPGIELVGAASSGEEAIEVVSGAGEDRPEVVLMDLSMPGIGGIEATRRLTAAQDPPSVVVLTAFAQREQILGALDAGAVGYLLKDAEAEEIFDAVRLAAAGESPIAPRAAREIVRERQERPVVSLTERERQVLELVAEGLANKVIAIRLGISEKTVKAHLTSVFTTLGVSDRTQAALWAQRNGIVANEPAPPPEG